MKVTSRFPAGPPLPVPDLLGELAAGAARCDLRVGDERIVRFLTDLAARLLAPAQARRHPELAALGFFLRRGELTRTLDALRDAPTTDTGSALRFPRGLVLHVPPANVDTIFVYSWALSALAGNTNVVRLSERSGAAASAVVTAMHEALREAPPEVAATVAATQRLIGYARDDSVTAALSSECDLRVVWGGDASVTALRTFPLAPASRDLTFPNRSSFAVISAASWRRTDETTRRAVLGGFYNDAFWFDQAACSSPRAVFWVGSEAEGEEAARDFTRLLLDVVREKGFQPEPAMAVQQRVGAYGLAATGAARSVSFEGGALATLELAADAEIPRDWLGVATFPHRVVGSLAELAALVRREDQTLTHFGFDRAELLALAERLGGRGIDRIVPVGSALSFAPVWDGYDLLREFTRLTTVTG
ncbi:acyl-CoA reductase [Actinoalloteichus spitiensis]|uniref:acyl-CoA reductase n=1 Tax=Actinoalloteichus spitiensis TaxID=252394 RepID=UPI00037F126E|nr:acyl-CoA reductase [Actinoalloteichus spitiensis]